MHKFKPSQHLSVETSMLLALLYRQQHQEALAQEEIRSARALCEARTDIGATGVCAEIRKL
jgi:hypothetical protein